MTHTHAKGQGRTSVGSKPGVKTDRRTDGQTDGGDCITSRDNISLSEADATHNRLFVHISQTTFSEKNEALRPQVCTTPPDCALDYYSHIYISQNYWTHKFPRPRLFDKKLCHCGGTARRALSVEISSTLMKTILRVF